MASPLKVRNIGFNRYLINKFIFIPIYILGTRNRTLVLAYFKREFHIMDKLMSEVQKAQDRSGSNMRASATAQSG